MTEFQQLRIEENREITIVYFRQTRLSGVLEMERLEQELQALAEDEQHSKLVLNFTSVDFLSSQVLGAMVSLNRKVKARNGAVRFCSFQPQVLDVLTTSRLDTLFDIRPSLDDALRGF